MENKPKVGASFEKISRLVEFDYAQEPRYSLIQHPAFPHRKLGACRLYAYFQFTLLSDDRGSPNVG